MSDAKPDLEAELAKVRAERDRLRAEVTRWRECALYDPTMSGAGVFKGWDRSALDRVRRRAEQEADEELAAEAEGGTTGQDLFVAAKDERP